MTTTNPFEPPRTTDLDGGSDGPPGTLSPAALAELVAAAPWVRRLVRLSALAIALQVLSIGIDLGRRLRVAGITAVVIGSIVISMLFLRILRWYEGASERLRRGDATAVEGIIDALAAYLKLAGVVVAIATGVFLVFLAHGIATGRWLSWMRA